MPSISSVIKTTFVIVLAISDTFSTLRKSLKTNLSENEEVPPLKKKPKKLVNDIIPIPPPE
jgi:hypothetical protein